MSVSIRNLVFLLLSVALFLFVRSNMQYWMDSKQVIAFEFLKTEAAATDLLNSAAWQPSQPPSASKAYRLRQNTYWDFLFIVGYVLTLLSLAHVLLGNSHRYLKTILWMLVAAGLADMIENFLLLQILDGARGWFPAAMWGFAWVKFGLLGVYVGFLVVGLVRRTPRPR